MWTVICVLLITFYYLYTYTFYILYLYTLIHDYIFTDTAQPAVSIRFSHRRRNGRSQVIVRVVAVKPFYRNRITTVRRRPPRRLIAVCSSENKKNPERTRQIRLQVDPIRTPATTTCDFADYSGSPLFFSDRVYRNRGRSSRSGVRGKKKNLFCVSVQGGSKCARSPKAGRHLRAVFPRTESVNFFHPREKKLLISNS